MKFEISPEYVFFLMKNLHQNVGNMTEKEFAKELHKIDSIYKKIDFETQGEYHHMWCEYLKQL